MTAALVALPAMGLGANGVLVTSNDNSGAPNANSILWHGVGGNQIIAAGTPGSVTRTRPQLFPIMNAAGTAVYVQEEDALGGTGKVVAYSRNAATGVVSGTELSRVTMLGVTAAGLALTPGGTVLYGISQDFTTGRSFIERYSVNAGTGAVTFQNSFQVNPADPADPGNTASQLTDLMVSPDGTSLYVFDTGVSNAIYQFTIGSGGALSVKSPYRVEPGIKLFGPVFTANGAKLTAFTGAPAGVAPATFNVDPTSGTLSAAGALPAVHATPPVAARMSPAGSFVVGNHSTGLFSVPVNGDGSMGTPTMISGVFVAPSGYTVRHTGFDISPDGQTAYVGSTAIRNSDFSDAPSQAPGVASVPMTASGPTLGLISAFPTQTINYGGVAVSPPQAAVAALTVSSVTVNNATAFDASGSTSPDSPISQYAWDFGDGSSSTTAGATTSHTYAHAGDYTTRVTVTNAAGCSTANRFDGHRTTCAGGASATITKTAHVASNPVNSLIAVTYDTGANQGILWSGIADDGLVSPEAPGTLPTPIGDHRAQPVINATGTVAYVQQGASVVAYARNRITGALTTTPIDTESTWGDTPQGLALAPNGNTLMAVSQDSGEMNSRIYRLDVAPDGTLSFGGYVIETGVLLTRPIVHPNGRSLYVMPQGGVRAVYQFDISASGSLTPKAPEAVSTGGLDLTGPVITGHGTRLSAFTMGAASVPAVVSFDINPSTGALTAAGSFPTPVGTLDLTAQVTPDGTQVVGGWASGVFTVPVSDDGILGTPSAPVVVFPIPPGPFRRFSHSALSLSPDGRFVYVGGWAYNAFGQPAPASNPGVTSVPLTPAGFGTPERSAFPALTYVGIAVSPAQPPLAALAAASATVGLPTTLNAGGSTSPDAAIATYTWDFGDGSAPATTTQATTTHTYAQVGTFTARVTLTNTAGCGTASRYTGTQNACTGGPSATATASMQVAAVPVAPEAPASGGGEAAPAPAPAPTVCTASTAPVSLRTGRTYTPGAAKVRTCATTTPRLALVGKASRRACAITRAGAVRGLRPGTCTVTSTSTVGGRTRVSTIRITVK